MKKKKMTAYLHSFWKWIDKTEQMYASRQAVECTECINLFFTFENEVKVKIEGWLVMIILLLLKFDFHWMCTQTQCQKGKSIIQVTKQFDEKYKLENCFCSFSFFDGMASVNDLVLFEFTFPI